MDKEDSIKSEKQKTEQKKTERQEVEQNDFGGEDLSASPTQAKSENILEHFDAKDRQELLDLLNEFIAQSYRIEEEFREYKALYQHVIEILPQAIWVFNDDLSIFYRNTQAQGLHKMIVPVIEAKAVILDSVEMEFEKKTYLLQSNTLENKMIITATDITTQKRQERLAAMGQISAHLAHEIRNPIGSISLLAATLLKKVETSNKPIIFEIQKSLWRVERQIKATLLFSRGLSLSRAEHRLSDLQEELESILNQYTYTKNISIHYNFNIESYNFDFDLMGIVLQNFLYNAVDAIEESDVLDGEIRIWTQLEGDNLCFFIKDNGKPIENKHLLFEPFETTKLKGNGLGLALSLQIIEAHNGKIELVDEKEKIFKIVIG